MKAEIGISALIGPDNWRKADFSMESIEGETPQQLLDRTADIVESWFKRRYGVDGSTTAATPSIPIEKPIPEEDRKAALIKDIYACTTLEKPNGLESYRTLADQDQLAKQAFDIMFKKLNK